MFEPTTTLAKLWEWAWLATARLQGWGEREWERRLLSWMHRQHAQKLTFWTMVRVWRLGDKAGCEWQTQQGVHWLQVCARRDYSYIAWILLQAHCLTVKLSPCTCSHSSLAGQIAAHLCGHSKCNLLVAQAHPRMIQHLTSYALVHKQITMVVYKLK